MGDDVAWLFHECSLESNKNKFPTCNYFLFWKNNSTAFPYLVGAVRAYSFCSRVLGCACTRSANQRSGSPATFFFLEKKNISTLESYKVIFTTFTYNLWNKLQHITYTYNLYTWPQHIPSTMWQSYAHNLYI
jgi:hypothetical protein